MVFGGGSLVDLSYLLALEYDIISALRASQVIILHHVA